MRTWIYLYVETGHLSSRKVAKLDSRCDPAQVLRFFSNAEFPGLGASRKAAQRMRLEFQMTDKLDTTMAPAARIGLMRPAAASVTPTVL